MSDSNLTLATRLYAVSHSPARLQELDNAGFSGFRISAEVRGTNVSHLVPPRNLHSHEVRAVLHSSLAVRL
jgi:hypothetical protein